MNYISILGAYFAEPNGGLFVCCQRIDATRYATVLENKNTKVSQL